jgi:hypothetical protein
MSYTANNALLFNAAIQGFAAGAFAGTIAPAGTSGAATPATYAAIVLAAGIFAEAVDTAIANDSGGSHPISGSGSGGPALQPSTATIQQDQFAKVGLLQMLCYAAGQGRQNLDITEADYLTVGTYIAAQYTEALTILNL